MKTKREWKIKEGMKGFLKILHNEGIDELKEEEEDYLFAGMEETNYTEKINEIMKILLNLKQKNRKDPKLVKLKADIK